MRDTKQFIEKAIEGGWKEEYKSSMHIWPDLIVTHTGKTGWNEHKISKEQIFLDPKAWQAVGKVEGWIFGCNICTDPCLTTGMASPSNFSSECKRPKEHMTEDYEHPWVKNMHQMIDALAEGKSLEEFIGTL